ncbi:DUF2269 family protein [Ramlibacter albus]|uniref:DUF2269 domain-containing protein n=1 Tax=Ramlibacter albus TaxID=2079448 RepID=A0A923S319_9BURK|nr:DUF2269 domain-containing protein [Ramlibacter albus]MBC5765980.1 DUF2269 domain-containing protein [Ramlibacter albus]
MDYLVFKWVHILSSTILFGAGVGSAFHLLAATLGRDTAGVAQATRTVVLADWLFTTPTAILQPLTGVWLVHLMGLPLSTPWIAASLVLYAIAMACWLPVLWLQLRLRDIAAQALREDSRLPRAYWRFFAWWVGLGFGGLFSFLAIFWLMVSKRA